MSSKIAILIGASGSINESSKVKLPSGRYRYYTSGIVDSEFQHKLTSHSVIDNDTFDHDGYTEFQLVCSKNGNERMTICISVEKV